MRKPSGLALMPLLKPRTVPLRTLDATDVLKNSTPLPAPIGLEMLTKARTLGGDVAAVYLGEGSADALAELGRHGAATVYQISTGDDLPAGARPFVRRYFDALKRDKKKKK